MSVTTVHSIREYTSTGVETVLTVDFQFLAPEHLIVSKGATGVETPLVLGTDYTVTGPSAPLPGTGSITLTAPATAGHKVRIVRSTPRNQLTTLSPAGPISTAAVVSMDDKLTLIVQELADAAAIAGTFLHGNLGGADLHAVATDSVNGFYAAAERVLNNAHRANTSNPHGVTAAQAGAAPAAHVGSILTTDHPEATQTTRGFLSAADKTKLDGLTNGDPLQVFSDDFDGPGLDTTAWTRSLTATNPAASILGSEWGVYRELTDAGSATSAVLLRATAKGPATKRNPTWEARLAFGAQGSLQTNCTARWGLAADPTVAVDYAYFDWNGTTLVARSRALGTEQFTSLATPDFAHHVYRIVCTSGSVTFYVDGVAVATHTTNIPTSTAPLERFFEIKNTSANARSLDIDYCKVSWTRAYT